MNVSTRKIQSYRLDLKENNGIVKFQVSVGQIIR